MVKNIIVYHKIKDEDIFLSSLKNNTKVIKYNQETLDSQLLNLIDDETKYIGFVYHFKGYNKIPFFNDYIYDYEKKFYYIRDRFKNLLNNISTDIIIDLLTCNVRNKDFINEIDQLNHIIRYSSNEKGNLSDWIQESHNVNIKDIYFNDNIKNWNYVLSNAITGDNIVGINNINKKDNIYYLEDDITWSNNDFITLEDGDVFDGNFKKIYIDVNNFEGLFSLNSDSFNTIIRNLEIKIINNNILSPDNGLLLKTLQSNCKILRCINLGNFLGDTKSSIDNYFCGALVGSYCSNIHFSFCINYGLINGLHSGGLAGSGLENGYILNCINYGDIYGTRAGGLVGSICFDDSQGNIKNCITKCDYAGPGAGGMTGRDTARNGGVLDIDQCFCIINEVKSAGGITGLGTAYNNGKVTINNCYSIISIIDSGGGTIGGRWSINSGGNLIINKCYSTKKGRIFGTKGDTSRIQINDCIQNADTIDEGFGNADISNCSINLSDISNKLYNSWNSSIWKIGNDTNNYPILHHFNNYPFLQYNKNNNEPIYDLINESFIDKPIKIKSSGNLSLSELGELKNIKKDIKFSEFYNVLGKSFHSLNKIAPNVPTNLNESITFKNFYDLSVKYNAIDRIQLTNTPVIAYGFRKLFNNYNGPIFKARRSNDNLEANIYMDTNGNVIKIDNSSSLSLNSWSSDSTIYITTWYDQGPNKVNAVQSDNSSQPYLNNMKNGIYFSSSSVLLVDDQISNIIDSNSINAFSFFSNCFPIYSNSRGLMGGGSRLHIEKYSDGSVTWRVRISDYNNTQFHVFNNFVKRPTTIGFSYSYNDKKFIFIQDGILRQKENNIEPGNFKLDNNNGSIEIGSSLEGKNRPWLGYIKEIILFDKPLTGTDLEKLDITSNAIEYNSL